MKVDAGAAESLVSAAAVAGAATAAPASLRGRLLWRVLPALAITWGLGSAIALTVARHFTEKALDRSLLDDAYAIAAQVSVAPDAAASAPGGLVFNLSPREAQAVLFDQSERSFFAVLAPSGALVAGQGGLGRSDVPDGEIRAFADTEQRGLALRRVTLDRTLPAPFTVVVAQTVRDRVELLGQLLVLSVMPQVLLLGLLGLWTRNAIGRELQPLEQLERAIEQRGSRDLEPLGVVANTTDLARLTAAFDALLARIHEAHAAQREFTGNVAHELRTPLAGIRSLAEFGLREGPMQAPLLQAPLMQAQLRRILTSTERASHLIDQLLAMALAEEMREGLPLVWLAADEVLRELLLALLPRADALGIDLGANGLDVSTVVRGNRALLEGLVGNLLDNALRYGKPGPGLQQQVTLELLRVPLTQGTGASVNTALATHARDDAANAFEVWIAVTDNGPGMDDAQRQQVRQRWAQGAEGQRVGEGSGLGLAIAARYAQLMGGRFVLESAAPGPGLRAAVALPHTPSS